MPAYILSRIQAIPLLDACRSGKTCAQTSLDLQMTRTELPVTSKGVVLPDGNLLSVESLKQIARKDDNCFVVEGDGVEAVHRFSHRFNRAYTLRATAGAPTMLISGFPMHRIKGTTPDKDTDAKIKAVGPLGGRILDTTTGLGYTAIKAARTGSVVTTMELDPVVLTVARVNPWSQELFDNPRIEQRTGSSFDLIKEFPDASFDAILHDPPTFTLAGELYSGEFYIHAHRVLRSGGKLFHYIGDLDSRSGRVVSKGVVRRLQEAGFKKVVRHPEAFALMVYR